MARLKKRTELLYELAERLELPEEIAAGAARLTVTGRRALIENHSGILECDPERIVVNTESGRLLLSGTSLVIKGMDKGELLIGGRFQHVEWE